MEENRKLKFLYQTYLGRFILKLLTRPMISKIGGFLLNTRISALWIPKFIKENHIDCSEYEERKYLSYNDFFTRKIKLGKRIISDSPKDFVSPCDSKLKVYHIDENSVFSIKNSIYKIEDLVNDKTLALEYFNGYCFIFRLSVDDYHHYCYIDDGNIVKHQKIKGILHTVQEIAVDHYAVYIRNAREYMILDTKNFEKIVQIEVGALMVGRIQNDHICGHSFIKGEEKGHFEFGGSTIIVLVKPGIVEVRSDILFHSLREEEVIVKQGEVIATKK